MLIYLLNTKQAMRSCLSGWQDIFGLANRALQTGNLPALYQTRIVSPHRRGLEQLAKGPARTY